MKYYFVEETAVINASASHVYNIIADYQEGHQAILPRDYFDEMIVTKGGQGTGTEITVHMSVMGVKVTYQMLVTEPEPGHIIAEEDAEAGVRTTFTVDPLEDGTQCRVTIHTKVRVKSGLAGFIEKLMNPPVMRRIYREELANLEKVAQSTLQPAS